MRTAHFSFAALLLLAGIPTAGAADLALIDRTLIDEPIYQTATPTYGLLVFGREAKTRVWLVHDGTTLHINDSPDGVAAPRWRKVIGSGTNFTIGDIVEDGGKIRHTRLYFRVNPVRPMLWVNIDGVGLQRAGWDREGKFAFAATAEEAPVIHFNGPATMDLFRDQGAFRPGDTGSLDVVVGTPGIGPGTFAAYTCSAYPKGAHPRAVIEFPPHKPGGPLVSRIALDDD